MGLFDEKTEEQKYRDTVPLSKSSGFQRKHPLPTPQRDVQCSGGGGEVDLFIL
jgi:hypothetical protein